MDEPKLRFPEFKDEWERKTIKDILSRVGNAVDVKEGEKYREIGIRSHGKGLFYKDETDSNELGNKRVFWIEPDCFIVNIVFAWERAVARTTYNEVGMIASHRFPMYKPDESQVDLDYITTYFTSNKGQQVLILASPGGAGRNKTLGQKEFSTSTILIPSINEQKKIASFIKNIDVLIEASEEEVSSLQTQKKGLMQKIFSQEVRFMNENGDEYPAWERFRLSEFATRITRKNKDNICTIPLTISAQYGLINQEDFFNKAVASKDMSNYYLLQNGEFAFNKSSSKEYPVGAIKRLEKYDEGCVSPLYICFSVQGIYSDFIVQYFESDSWHNAVREIATEGARNHGILNISPVDFFDTEHYFPGWEEQKKIAECLNCFDKAIDLAKQELDKWKVLKQGLLQEMFV